MATTHTASTSSTEPRRVPAGHAVAVVLLSLLICAFVDADSLVASIEQQPFSTSRTVGLALARPVRTISHWTGLDLPMRLLDDIINGGSHGPARVVVPANPVPPSLTTLPVPHNGATASPTTPTTLPGPRRVPSAANPLRVWMAGDSLMGSVAESFAELTSGRSDITVSADVRVGTGLVRPDVYDWPAAVGQQMAKDNPDVVVLMFGANDDQNLVANGHTLPRFSDAWRQEYTRRVSQILAEAAADGRQVIWLGVPAVTRSRLNQTKTVMNSVVSATAPLFPNAAYIDSGMTLDGPGGSFATYLNNASGQPVKVRESDGIHITLAGANRLTPQILTPVEQYWRLTP